MKIRTIAALGAAAGLAGLANAALIANSTADFGAQGDNGWFYGFNDGIMQAGGDDFELFTIRTSSVFRHSLSETWTFGNGSTMHGNAGGTSRSDVVQDSVRRWVSSVDGEILISGEIAHAYSTPSGDGTTASIFVDGVQVYEFVVNPGDNNGEAYRINANVAQGSIIDFVLSSGETANFDSTFFTSQIDTVEIPAPATAALLGLGGFAAARRRR